MFGIDFLPNTKRIPMELTVRREQSMLHGDVLMVIKIEIYANNSSTVVCSVYVSILLTLAGSVASYISVSVTRSKLVH